MAAVPVGWSEKYRMFHTSSEPEKQGRGGFADSPVIGVEAGGGVTAAWIVSPASRMTCAAKANHV